MHCAFVRRLHETMDHHARTQVTPDQLQHPLVAYLAGNAAHEDVVLDAVKEFRQVHVHDEAVALLDIALSLLDGSVCGTLWSKTETRLGEVRIEDRRENLQDGLLD